MREPSDPQQRDAAATEAAGWTARLDRGLERDEQREFDAWLARPENRRALDEIGALWRELESISELHGHAASPVRTRSEGRQRRTVALPLAAAAAITVAVLTGLSLPDAGHLPQVASLPRPSIHETPVGAYRSVELDDGSSVVLNTGTRIRVEYSTELRNITLLSGEAYFDVAHDAARPFRVRADARAFEALGTAFSVHRMTDSVELIVTEGRVRVDDGDDGTIVVAGERSLIGSSGLDVHGFGTSDSDAALAWRRGMLVFEDTPLGEVLDEAGRYSTTRLVLGDPALGELRVAGYFRAGDVDGLLAALRRNFAIESRGRGGEIVLTAR